MSSDEPVLVVEDGAPLLRLLAWGLAEEGFATRVCAPGDLPGTVAAMRPQAVVLNCGSSDQRALIDTLPDYVTCRAILDSSSEPLRSDGVTVIGPPYRISDVVACIRDERKELPSGAR